MDYDGANQQPLTHLGTVSLSPRISPDNTRLAFSSLGKDGFQIRMYSLLLGRMVNFQGVGGTNLSPAWAPNGKEIAYSSSRSGDPEIWISDANGALARRITSFRGPDVSPVYNPRTGSQIAWISGRTGLPQLYIMDTDGSSDPADDRRRLRDLCLHGRPTASSSPSPGTASTAPAHPADRTSTLWRSPPNAGSSSLTMAAAATSPPGRQTAGISSTPTPPTARRAT